MADKAFYCGPDGSGVAFGSADSTNAKVIHQFPVAGGRLMSMHFTNDTTVAQVMAVYRRKGGVNSLIREVAIPVGAGIGGASVIELLDPTRMPAMGFVAALLDGVPFGPSQEIWGAMKTAISSGSVVAQVIPGAG